MAEMNQTEGRPDTDAEAILALAEQSASAIQAMPGYDAGREGYAVTVLNALVRAGRLILHERGERGTSGGRTRAMTTERLSG